MNPPSPHPRPPRPPTVPERRIAPSARAALVFLGLLSTSLWGAGAVDWPAYRHDNRRSGITPESLRLPLKPAWTYASPTPPQTAWSGPAKWDSYANIRGLESMRNFDPAFFVTVAGDLVYFGSSVDDAVHCLEAASGMEKWVFSAEGPVRLPPAWSDGKVYFGSDDGFAYCLDAVRGTPVWKRKPSGQETLILHNGKLISHWPCRTGVLVQGGVAYFGASLLPWERSYLCAVDAATGADEGPGRYCVTFEHLTMQGAMLATDTALYLPQGRQRPEMFELATGRSIGGFGGSGEGGIFAVVTRTDEFVHGRGQNHQGGGELRGFDANSRDYFVTFPKATRLVVTDETAYLNLGNELAGFARARYVELAKQQSQLQARRRTIQEQLKQLPNPTNAPAGEPLRAELKSIDAELAPLPEKMAACFWWRTRADYPHELILAGETLFAGGDGRLAAFEAKSGQEQWSARVTGKVHGLAVANGRLYASTDRGAIHCFTADAAK